MQARQRSLSALYWDVTTSEFSKVEVSWEQSQNFKKNLPLRFDVTMYRTRSIITRSLYILNPLFESQKRFFKEFFLENSAFMYG